MITTVQDVIVRKRSDFERLPKEGLWEVVEGRAILLPAPDFIHQRLSHALVIQLDSAVKKLGCGYIVATVDVFIPVPPGEAWEAQARVPDLIVSKHRPAERFEVGDPPDLVIEILSSRRGNVERTEKVEEYARAGVFEYWIVDRFTRAIEVYVLEDGQYDLKRSTAETLQSEAFPGLEIDLKSVWAVLD